MGIYGTSCNGSLGRFLQWVGSSYLQQLLPYSFCKGFTTGQMQEYALVLAIARTTMDRAWEYARGLFF